MQELALVELVALVQAVEKDLCTHRWEAPVEVIQPIYQKSRELRSR